MLMPGGRTERRLARAILAGAAIDAAIGLVLIVAPVAAFELLGFPLERDPQIWVRFAGLSQIVFGLVALQAGLSPLRNGLLLAAILLARLLVIVFFAVAMLAIGTLAYGPILLVEAVLLLVPAVLLSRAFRENLAAKP